MNESAKYCAFLRGVNVNGTTMKMADVCNVFSKAGVENVSSVLASGNILFQSNKSVSELRTSLENAMSKTFNYEAFLFIKSEKELKKILENSPFEKNKEWHSYVFIAEEKESQEILEEFELCSHQENEKGSRVNSTFYWQIPKQETLNSEFGKILGKKKFKDKFTSRNINTIEKIVKKF